MSNEAALSMRIVSADFYSFAPNPQIDQTYNHFRGSVIKQLPIIRIFGITSTGEKACVHIHGVFPYIYVPFPKDAPKGSSIHYEVAEGLDEALNNSFSSKKQYISKVTTVSAKPFYGYHSEKEDFLKIEFYQPMSVKRGITLLQAGAVCNQSLQPHEAHVPYILQFFIDYNLYGMSFLNLSQFILRLADTSNSSDSSSFTKVTKCAIELDASRESILNHQSSSRVLNPGLNNIRKEEERRHEEDGVPLDQSTPTDLREYQPTSSDIRFKKQLENALTDRRRAEISNEFDNSQTTSSQQTRQVHFDSQDISLLKVLFNRVINEDLPDEDSVLGFTPEENHDEPEADLSQPYISFHPDADEEDSAAKEVDLSETLVWPEVDGLSQIHCEPDSPPLYVDGNMDDEETPEKKPRKTRKQTSPRYVPLDFKLHKSPRRKISDDSHPEAPSSPELFKKFEKDVESLRNIRSPECKFEENTLQDFPMIRDQIDDPDIICDSDNSDTTRDPKKKVQFDFLVKTSKSTLLKKSKKKSAIRRVLFDPTPSTSAMPSETNTSYLIDEDILKINKDMSCTQSLTSIPKVVDVLEYNVNTFDEDHTSIHGVSNTNDSEDHETTKDCGNTEENNCNTSDGENNDADKTWYSQSTILSFYGDTTICPSPLEYNTILRPLADPPDPADVSSNLHSYGLEGRASHPPFYSDPRDAKSSSKEVGWNVISLKSKCANDLEEFKGEYHVSNWLHHRPSKKKIVILEPAVDPPSSISIAKELELMTFSETCSITSATPSQSDSQRSISQNIQATKPKSKMKKKTIAKLDRKKRQSGDIENSTPNNSGMFKLDFQNLQDAQFHTLHKYTTLMVLELHTNTRGSLRPDPEYDAVEAIFYTITNDVPPTEAALTPRLTGVILVDPEHNIHRYQFSCFIETVGSEAELYSALIKLVDYHNPDIVAGYEIEMLSWGYLIERGYVLGLNLMSLLSRIKADCSGSDTYSEKFTNKDYDLRIPGRIVLNVWRLMRHEVALMSYTYENLAYHVLHTRVPKFSFKTLTFWWNHLSKLYRHLVLKYYISMVDGIEKLLDQLNLVGRTCELASLFGIQFYEVFSRGSQFRVESMMLRLSKRLGLTAVSPSVEQRAQMRAPASLPLIMEPESRFYSDPVIVLDFQSLYPSMMIAYNYCYSTCLGRVSNLMESSEFKFGCTELKVPLKELIKLQKNIHISPAGVAFVDKSVWHGVLPQMLEGILQTRLLVKASLKRHKSDKLLSRVLDARQLGLKLIANVTYGYTSANFSGRMPCIEVGDSVVSKGRETLERAIQLVEREERWRARVVYGDTDSMFVLCPGRSREEAFAIGQQIADRVTADNPPPVKLKLEKVYQPCILQTKKRYVGYMYESPDQVNPVYDAKGIETVRRDGCPAASKILEKSLKLLFERNDMSEVKAYVVRQAVKVLSGRLSPAELTFAKEYRGLSGYQPNAPVPALKIAKELLRADKRGEPRSGERVGYVVVCGPPGLPLISLVRSLPDFLDRPSYVINADYYLSKAILPPLARCFSLLGADVFQWYSNVPKKQLLTLGEVAPGKRKATIAQYFRSIQCLACGSLTPFSLCEPCRSKPAHTLALLTQTVSKLERKQHTFNKICESCCARNFETDCVSLDCPVFYRRLQASNDCTQTTLLYETIEDLSQF